MDLLNWLGTQFSFLPQWHPAMLLGSSWRRRPVSALHNNSTHYFPVDDSGCVLSHLCQLELIFCLGHLPNLSLPVVPQRLKLWLKLPHNLTAREVAALSLRHRSAQAVSFHMRQVLGVDAAHDNFEGVNVVSFPEFDATKSHEKRNSTRRCTAQLGCVLYGQRSTLGLTRYY